MLSTSNATQVSQIIFAGNFNLFFNSKLESDEGNSVYKNRFVTKLIELKDKYTLTDIWRIRNPYIKGYTFRQNDFSGFIQRCLDYIFISNSIQEYIDATDILLALSTGHSHNLISFCLANSEKKSADFWKFNNSSLLEENFTSNLEAFIKETKTKLNSEEILDPQVKQEFLKYEIRKYVTIFSKCRAKELRKSKADLEPKLKLLERSLDNDACVFEYNHCKKQLEKIFENISGGIRVRSRCQWYKEGEKSTKDFLNNKKLHSLQGKVRKIIVNSKEITSNSEIRKELRNSYKAFFKNYNSKPSSDHEEFLEKIDIPKLDICDKDLCDKDLS